MQDTLLAVHSVDRIDLAVPDLDEARRFYLAFGLDARPGADDRLYVGAHGVDHAVLTLQRGHGRKLLGLRLGLYAADLPRFAERLQAAGHRFDRRGDMLTLVDPDGTPLTLAVAPKTSPSNGSDPRAAPRTMAPSRSRAPAVRPTRFSHALLFTRDVDASLDFYIQVLGLKLSDRSGSDIAFLHSPHGSDHHLIAFVRSERPGLHHSSWDVRTIDDVGLGAQQMARHGYEQGWGVGRHVLGSNYFYYARDPWGGYTEYSFDIDFVPPGTEWPAANHDGEDAFYVWGPPPPDGFALNTESA